MSDTDKLPIMQAVRYSWSFASTAAMPTLPAYLIKAGIAGFAFAAMQAGETAAGLGLFGLILWFIASIACLAMTLRLALRGEYSGFIGLQASPDETRLAAAQFLYHLVFGLVVLISGFVVWMLAASFIATTIPDMAAIENDAEAFQQALLEAFQTPTGTVVSILAIIAFFLPVLWFMSRLITFPAATLARQKVMIFETWNWTRGHAFQIIIAIIVAIGPFWLLSQLIQWVATMMLGLPWLIWTEETVNSMTRMQAFMLGTFAGVATIPMALVSVGLSAFMYRGFDPDLS